MCFPKLCFNMKKRFLTLNHTYFLSCIMNLKPPQRHKFKNQFIQIKLLLRYEMIVDSFNESDLLFNKRFEKLVL